MKARLVSALISSLLPTIAFSTVQPSLQEDQGGQDTRPDFVRSILPRHGVFRAETGLSWLNYNLAEIPENSTSSRFSLRDLLSSQGKAFGRFTYDIPLRDNVRGVRFVVALLDQTGYGLLSQPALIRGKAFGAGIPTSAAYRFNGYRATYWWRISQTDRDLVRLGVTLNMREARIRVTQGSSSESVANIGPVPLLYFQLDHKLDTRWTSSLELDAFAVPGGRAVDANARLAYQVSTRADLTFGLRVLDGLGDEPGTVYNSIRYTYATVGLGWRF